jgi:hypothetical protein
MFYGLKVRMHLMTAARGVFGDETASALGRAISHTSKDWKLLLQRLKRQGLSAKEAAAVAAAWLAVFAPDDRKDFPFHRAMNHAANVLQNQLGDEQGFTAYGKIARVLKGEGLALPHASDVS